MVLIKLLLLCVISYVHGTLDYEYLDTATNPFVYLDSNNYTYENHSIITEDGYILLAVRIPYGEFPTTNTSGPPVIFVHGFLAEFYDFLNSGPGVSIGFDVLDAGYDVWLLNTRGNTFSRKHVTLDPDNSTAFWNFRSNLGFLKNLSIRFDWNKDMYICWHEVGIYDLPATIDYITNLTGYSNISYIGHSQGTTAFLVLTSSLPEYNEIITISILLAPVAYLQYAQQPLIVFLKNYLELYEAIVDLLELGEVAAYNSESAAASRIFCNIESPGLDICEQVYYFANGPSNQINDSMLSVTLTNNPAGGSIKEATHYLQNANSGEFRLFDYGTDGNELTYNQTIPPSYNISAITAPIALYYGNSDYFVALRDVARLAIELPNVVGNNLILYDGTDHFDVILGTQVTTLVNKPAITVLNKYNN